MTTLKRPLFLVLAPLFLLASFASAGESGFPGSWKIDPTASTAFDPWSLILLDITVEGDAVTIQRTVSAGNRRSSQVYPLQIGQTVKVPSKWWTGNRHIGAYMGGDKTETISTSWLDNGKALRVESHYILTTSQGDTPVRSYFEYRLSADGDELTVIELRSSRNKPVVQVFRRA